MGLAVTMTAGAVVGMLGDEVVLSILGAVIGLFGLLQLLGE